MGKRESINIECLKFFEIGGRNTHLQKNDTVIYRSPNGKPPSISFERKNLPMTINGYTNITHDSLVNVDEFERWFSDFSRIFNLNARIELIETNKETVFVFKIVK